MSPATLPAQRVEVLVVGAGFAGLGMAIKLKKAGIDSFLVIEKESGLGGTWRVNSYPGCACDVQSHLYSYSFEMNPLWSRMFATQPEILAYLEHCAREYGLEKHLQFDTALDGAEWDEGQGLWKVRAADGRRYEASVLVCEGPQLLAVARLHLEIPQAHERVPPRGLRAGAAGR